MSIDLVWNSITTAGEIGALIDALDFQGSSYADLAELKCTVQKTKSLLLPFLHHDFNDPAYDVCLKGIFDVLQKLHLDLSSLPQHPLSGSLTSQQLEPASTRINCSIFQPDCESTESSSSSAAASPSQGSSPFPAAALSSSNNPLILETLSKDPKISIFRNDLLLSQRVDQFIALFPSPNEKLQGSSSIIDDRQGGAWWCTAFGEAVSGT